MKRATPIALVALIACWPLAPQAEINIVFNIPDSERETIFFSDFDDDEGWDLDGEGIAKLKIDNGVFTIDRSKADNSYLYIFDGGDLSEDFTIEAKMRKTKGKVSSSWYGIAWDYLGDGDYSNILVGTDGTYNLAFAQQGNYKKVVDWEDFSVLEEKNKWNTLRIEHRAPDYTIMGQRIRFMHNYKYHFYINDALVRSFDDWPTLFGDQIAFRLSGKTKIEIDYIKITRP